MNSSPNTVTYLSWKTRLLSEIWPAGPPENLPQVLDTWFAVACMNIQREVKNVQLHNHAAFPFCATGFNAWTTYVCVPGPMSKIRRVYTVANGDFTNKVWYRQRGYGEVLKWSQNLLSNIIGAPPATAFPPGLLGDRPSDQLTDKYASWGWPLGAYSGRARRGIWAREKGRLYLSPWIQSNEIIYVEWDGIKTQWLDTDLVDLDRWTFFHEETIKWFIKHQYQANFEADRTAEQFAEKYYHEKLALLIIDCREETEEKTESEIPQTYSPTGLQLLSETVTITPVVTTVGIIANYGTQSINSVALGILFNYWKLNGIVTAGGNNLGDDSDFNFWDTVVGQLYSGAMDPYEGGYTGGSENKFWPALCDAELADLDVFLEYFGALQQRRYYTTEIGDIQFFILNTSVFEPDGITVRSPQAVWLQAALAMSTANWKVVVLNGSPFSSGAIGSNTQLQWPFKKWGADIVISGNETDYERLFVNYLPYIVVGTGGETLTPFSRPQPVDGSLVRSATTYGGLILKSTQPYAVPGQLTSAAILFTAPPPSYTVAVLEIAFVDTNGVQQDYLKLTKGQPGSTEPQLGIVVMTPPPSTLQFQAGYIALPINTSNWTFQNLNLPFQPTVVQLSVSLPPNGGVALDPKMIGLANPNGFYVDLNGTTDQDQLYVLSYVAYGYLPA